LWGLLGLGMLLKQSVLLFAIALPLFVVIEWRRLSWRPVLVAQQLVGLCLFLFIIAPVLIWERRHGWPMLAHTLGHLGLGADHATKAARGGPVSWMGSTLGGIVGAGGPPFLLLSIWASIRAERDRVSDPARWRDRLWILCAAWPGVLFFVGL